MSRFRLGSTLALAGILITVGGCADTPVAPEAPGAGLEKVAAPRSASFSVAGTGSSAVIGVEGGVLTTPDGHRIVFPAGALSTPTEIRIRDDAEFVGVHLEPHGLVFPAGRNPVLTLDGRGADLSGYQALKVVYVGQGGDILEVLRTGVAGTQVTARLQHFSGYIIAGERSGSTP